MAEALVSVLLERLAMLSIEKIERELKMVSEVKQEFENLTLKLQAIQAVLEDADQRQVIEASVKLWLSQLINVSFDMDDVLDEWITRVLMHQLEKQEKEGADAVVTTMKVCFPFPSSCFRFGQVNQLFLRHEIATRIKELNERLTLIDRNKQSFSFQSFTRPFREQVERQKTTSLPNVRTFGRDKEKNLIVSKLISESSQENEVPLIIPIVGMGGMGKTTLAQLVYNDENVMSHFNKRVWVCVSDPFEEIKISQAIIEELDKYNASKYSTVLQTLMSCIDDLIKGKKFLLVLDDVWNPKSSQWEELIKPLQNGAMGSRILVTTRNDKVATLMKATSQMIPLKELGDSFCLSLFYYNADMDESSVPEEFKDIGLEIVKKCNGLPLAAKTLGSLMRNKKTTHEWRAVLRSKIWELKEIQEDVFRPLLLSYHDLTLATKRSLLYCVIFPKDYVYNNDDLIEMWMSQDYLNATESKDNITVGQNYFDDLVMRSFFQDIEVDKKRRITCKIHDIVHDFLRYLTKNECLILDGGDIQEVPVSDRVHHLTSVDATKIGPFKSFLPRYRRLRTLCFVRNCTGSTLELIVQLKCLRTLKLCNEYFVEIPETIGGLIHLRYLDLSNNRNLKKLPRALGSLYNLQTLRLVGSNCLTRIYVERLINLRHLYVEGCEKLGFIEGINRLTHLERLDVFIVGYGVGERNKLEQLKDLNQLQGSLIIQMRGGTDMAENAGGIMVNKPNLLDLKLEFNDDIKGLVQFNESFDAGKQRKVMNGLEPHPDLEYLFITGYKGGGFSHWLSSIHSLRVLSLTVCPNCLVLPALGRLASLEALHINSLDAVKKVGVEFLGIDEGHFISFPKLKQLTIDGMWSCNEWDGVEEENSKKNVMTIMRCLSYLSISKCENLKALPDFLWNTPLQRLHISKSPILQELYRKDYGEQWAKISHIPNIKFG